MSTQTPTPRPRGRKPRTTEPSESPFKVSEPIIERLADVFKLLADKSRLKIVLALAQEGRMHVTALCALLHQSQPAVSHHLTLMRILGLVTYDRVGKNNFYYLASDRICDLLEDVFPESGNGHRSIQLPDFALSYRRRKDG